MPIPVFIDTSALYALEDRSDEHHQEAVLFRNDDLSTGGIIDQLQFNALEKRNKKDCSIAAH